jgi:hypothetical protein
VIPQVPLFEVSQILLSLQISLLFTSHFTSPLTSLHLSPHISLHFTSHFSSLLTSLHLSLHFSHHLTPHFSSHYCYSCMLKQVLRKFDGETWTDGLDKSTGSLIRKKYSLKSLPRCRTIRTPHFTSLYFSLHLSLHFTLLYFISHITLPLISQHCMD